MKQPLRFADPTGISGLTAQALEVIGPRAFSIDEDFQRLETLGLAIETQSLHIEGPSTSKHDVWVFIRNPNASTSTKKRTFMPLPFFQSQNGCDQIDCSDQSPVACFLRRQSG